MNEDGMVYYPNVYIKNKETGKLYSLKTVHEKVYYDINDCLYNNNLVGMHNEMDIERIYINIDSIDEEEKIEQFE